MYYIIGAVVLVLVVAVGYAMRPKPAAPVTPVTPAAPTPTPGPISALGCERQYYNPKIGFTSYYLSVEGVDVKGASKIDCVISIEAGGKVIKTENVTSQVIQAPERNGVTFRCTTPELELEPKVPTTVNVALKDDLKASSSCSALFALP